MTDNPPRRLVVVGASLAGLRAVEAARRQGFEGRITLIGAEEHLPYDRPPLSKAYLDVLDDGDPQIPFFRTEDTFREELRVELMLGAAATGLDTDARCVIVGETTVPYDILVIATGAGARSLPGTDGIDGVHALRTLDDARAVREALESGARTVVIGAGFIGSEVASNANKRGLEVTVVEALPTPLVRAIGADMGTAIAALHEQNGTELLCGVGVSKILSDAGRVTGVELADGRVLPADLVIVGIGSIPATEWLTGSAVRLDNGVFCDEYLATGVPGVFAAGDVANWYNGLFDRHQRLEHWTSAAEQASAAIHNALHPESPKPYATVPYFWSDWYDSRIQFVGVTDADEIRPVEGAPGADRRWVALYRTGDRITGALAVNGQNVIMKYRMLIMRGASWAEALELAEKRKVAAGR